MTTLSTFLADVGTATGSAKNEAQLSANLESALEAICVANDAPWSPYSLEIFLKTSKGKNRFADAVHGAVIIEYERPRCFAQKNNRCFKHACKQAEEYTELLAAQEGRPINEYVMVVWDGETIAFGKHDGSKATWDGPLAFDKTSAQRLVDAIKTNGRPLVSGIALSQLLGPTSRVGTSLLPVLFQALVSAKAATKTTKTSLLFAEWNRLFGQVVGIEDSGLSGYIGAQSKQHGQDYLNNIETYLFALNTHIAILAKTVVACVLPNPSEDIRDNKVSARDRMRSVENGSLFAHSGLLNMVSGDFFSWYVDDVSWVDDTSPLDQAINQLLASLSDIDFDIKKQRRDATRDLFKNIYESCVPRELRHALGEFYTPDWLAEHGVDVLGWQHTDALLDPTCGSGTFLLEALKRRIQNAKQDNTSANSLLHGLWGTDLNPMAVLSAKASLAVFVSPYIQEDETIRLPVFLSDAINPTMPDGDFFTHDLPTEKGIQRFVLPRRMVESKTFYPAMSLIQDLIDDDKPTSVILSALRKSHPEIAYSPDEWKAVEDTIETIVLLHNQRWNGIWCSILADRFSAGSIPKVSHVCGNPPWVKWSHLPRDYADFIKPRCQAMGVFSEDNWVGGIESDISTVITYEAIDRYLADKGKLGFFITGTVFTNESSEGFRKFSLHGGAVTCSVDLVEDYYSIKPFDGVSNHPVFFVLSKGSKVTYPVTYRRWDFNQQARSISDKASFRASCTSKDLQAKPVPGGKPGSNRPWIIASKADHKAFKQIFASTYPRHTARKGVTTDRNGIFWVDVLGVTGKNAQIANLNEIGRTKGIARRTGNVEKKHVFPMLRGKDIRPFKSTPELHILVPQRGMHGDPDLVTTAKLTYNFLKPFKSMLEERSSLKRFQKNQAWYSLWSTGPYTFAKHKVAWKEMSGGRFCAAYVGSHDDPDLKEKRIIIPDHKLYFMTFNTAVAAHFTTGFLNAPTVQKAINAYAAKLSLGTSIADYVNIPTYDPNNADHKALSGLAKRLHNRSNPLTDIEAQKLNELALASI